MNHSTFDGAIFDNRSPIYLQIADRVKADVLNGTLKADEQVMSTNQYAAFFRINPATVAKAFQGLVDEGVLYKRRGIGMFVSSEAREKLRSEHRARFFSSVVEPMVAEARSIGIPMSEIIQRLQQISREEPK